VTDGPLGGRRGEPARGDQAPAPRKAFRPRPILVELASALLVVEGAVSLLFSIDVLVKLAQNGTPIEILTAISIALSTLNLGLGIAVRFGRLWVVTINVAAVLGFLELLSATPVGVLFGVLDVSVVLALVREKPWFDWMAAERAAAG
jgi:hypothetical protein